jgi:hypothetical protein
MWYTTRFLGPQELDPLITNKAELAGFLDRKQRFRLVIFVEGQYEWYTY